MKIRYKIKTYPADIYTPIGLYMKFVGKDHGILLESAEVDGRLGRYSLLAWDFKVYLKIKNGKMDVEVIDPEFSQIEKFKGKEYFKALKEIINTIKPERKSSFLPPITRSFIGFVGFECVSLMEPVLKKHINIEDAESIFVLPGKQILYDHLHLRCYYLSLDDADLADTKNPLKDETVTIGKIYTSFSKENFMDVVKKTKELIYQGEAIQIVLSTRFSSTFSGEPFNIYRRLRQANPSPYMFFLNLKDITLIGSSPELMVRSIDKKAEVRPIAGTRKRGRDIREDEEFAKELINDPKERAEHVMLVDLGRNDLGRIATPGSVDVEKFMEIEKFSHVMHLTSYVRAEIRKGLDAIDILKATFPAGTVSGAPKIRAIEIISEMEPISRGPYAGAIGWIGLGEERENIDTGIIIRSMWIKENTINWQAGAGIVADSVPEKEWLECHNKAKVIHQVLTKGSSDVLLK